MLTTCVCVYVAIDPICQQQRRFFLKWFHIQQFTDWKRPYLHSTEQSQYSRSLMPHLHLIMRFFCAQFSELPIVLGIFFLWLLCFDTFGRLVFLPRSSSSSSSLQLWPKLHECVLKVNSFSPLNCAFKV